MRKPWTMPMLTKLPGCIKRLSPHTNVCDTTSLVREYLSTVTTTRGALKDVVVYVRYGKDGMRKFKRALAVGPTFASVI